MKTQLADRKRIYLGIMVMLILCVASARAQFRVSSALLKPTQVQNESLLPPGQDSLANDTSAHAEVHRSPKSPATAIALSALLPSAGQIYTGRYWKVPLILGFGGYFVAQMLRMDDRYRDSRSRYSTSVLAGVNNGAGDPQLLYERDFYRDERDRFAFYVILTYVLNIVDAYVGASLYDFDVGDNLGGGTSVRVRIPIR